MMKLSNQTKVRQIVQEPGKDRRLILIFLIPKSGGQIRKQLKSEVDMSDEERNEDQSPPVRPEPDQDLSDPRKITDPGPSISLDEIGVEDKF